MLRDALSDVLPLADRVGVTLAVESGANLDAPVATPAMTSVLRNLLDNAVRYSPRGGTVVVNAGPRDAILAISVDDQGPGVNDPEAAVRPFTREGSQQMPGSGLGLPIVNELVHHIGGTLQIISSAQPPTGTTARVEVPLLSLRPGDTHRPPPNDD